MSISDYFEDDDQDFPLSFVEATGDHALTETIRKAVVWSSLRKFAQDDEDILSLIDSEDFTDDEKRLALFITFHGPYESLDKAMDESRTRTGIIVAPRHLWDDHSQFVFVAVLAN